MKKVLFLLACLAFGAAAQAQVVSGASFMKPSRLSNATVPFRYDAPGIQTPIEWGLDTQWLSETNVRTGVLYCGKDMIDIIRLSYRPATSVEDGTLSEIQTSAIDSRTQILKTWCKDNVGYYMNDENVIDDVETVDSWYNSILVSSEERAQRWAKVIDLTIDAFKQNGLTNLISILPFNEPDNYTGQGLRGRAQTDFNNICKLFKEDETYREKYADVRICGGNTLNTDSAYSWWNGAKAYLDEGNTHQLAGTFDHYADFFETLTDYGHHATNDELHNVMECMVGVEYGMQTGIWWGTCEYARSQFMKATYHRNPGDRLAYAEHRDNWTSASVYRQPTGQVQAFGGMSERQSHTTAYNFVSLDRPVWYNGERGRDFLMYLPGGTAYQIGQTNAEMCIDIQGGDDAMPHIGEGTYKIVNVNSGLLMGFNNNPSGSWTSARLRNNSNTYKYQQWNLVPLQGEDVWGDFSYYTFEVNNGNKMYLDAYNWGYTAGTDIGVYPGGGSSEIEQWYLEYAGNGAFYIRCRYSALCLDVANGGTSQNSNIELNEFTGEPSQQWRFIPTNVTPDLDAPAAPLNLKAQMQPASIKLTWDPSESTDVGEYAVLRNGSVLAKVEGCEFTDNEAEQDSAYTYSVYAIDKSLNYSPRSNEVANCSITDEKGIIMYLSFDETLFDETPNGNHCAVYGDTTYVADSGHSAISLSGTDNYIQLPYTIGSHDAMTVACWLRYGGGASGQHLFDFGNGPDQYMYLTANSVSGSCFAIKNGGEEETVSGAHSFVTTRWYHFVVTLEEGKASLYLNGELLGTNEHLTIKPSDIRPVLNYIGRSQSDSDPLLRGYVADFTVYNYALSAEEVEGLYTGIEDIAASDMAAETGAGIEYNITGRRATSHDKGIIIRDGKKVLR